MTRMRPKFCTASAIFVLLLLCPMLGLGAPQTAPASSSHESAPKAASTKKNPPNKLAASAKISMEQARTTALKKAPGKIESEELEREHGKLVYSFDIRTSDGTITEVQVSAINGKVVSVEHETKEQEAKEAQKEKSKKQEK